MRIQNFCDSGKYLLTLSVTILFLQRVALSEESRVDDPNERPVTQDSDNYSDRKQNNPNYKRNSATDDNNPSSEQRARFESRNAEITGLSNKNSSANEATRTSEQKARFQSRDNDNTGINTRDRNSKSVTPEMQSNDAKHMELTRRIREAIANQNGLSIYARNVKIITQENGVVTLRGPVSSQMEKERIEGVARQAAGSARVDSLLEVASNN